MNSTHQSPLRCQIQFHSTPTVFRFCHWLHIEKYVHQKHSRPARSVITSLSPPGGLKARMNDKLYFYFLPPPKKSSASSYSVAECWEGSAVQLPLPAGWSAEPGVRLYLPSSGCRHSGDRGVPALLILLLQQQ